MRRNREYCKTSKRRFESTPKDPRMRALRVGAARLQSTALALTGSGLRIESALLARCSRPGWRQGRGSGPPRQAELSSDIELIRSGPHLIAEGAGAPEPDQDVP